MKRLLKVTASTGMLTLLKMLMGFLIAKIVAIYTGPSGIAMLGQVQSAITAFNGVISSPVGNGIVRYTSEHKDNGYKYCSLWWKASVQWVLLLSVITTPVFIFFSKEISKWLFNNDTYAGILSLGVCTLPLSSLGVLFTSIINGHKNYKRYITLGMVSVFLSSIVMIVLIVFFNIQGAMISAVIQSALIGVVMIIGNLKQPWFKLQYFIGKTTAESRKQIGSYILMALTSAIMMPLTLIVIRNILVSTVGWSQTGEWQAVWKISEVYLSVITIALSTYYLPQLASLKNSDDVIEEIKKTAVIIIPLAIVMAVTVYLLRDLAIEILFTKDFTGARDIFLVQLIGDVIKIASWLYSFPMLSRGAIKWYISSEVFFSLLFMSLSLLLVPIYGIHGANYAYVLNYTIYFVFCFVFIKHFSR